MKLCYIALDFDTELTSTAESSDNDETYVLPDGTISTVSDERVCRSRCAKIKKSGYRSDGKR